MIHPLIKENVVCLQEKFQMLRDPITSIKNIKKEIVSLMISKLLINKL